MEIYEQYPVNALLILDDEFDRETRYEIDITSFFEEQLALEDNNENALLFITNDSDGSVTELAIGSQQNEAFQSKIELNTGIVANFTVIFSGARSFKTA